MPYCYQQFTKNFKTQPFIFNNNNMTISSIYFDSKYEILIVYDLLCFISELLILLLFNIPICCISAIMFI